MKSMKQYIVIITLFLLTFCQSFYLYADPVSSKSSPANNHTLANQININQASAEELAKHLNGIGLNKAKKIVEYREKFGPFVSIEQLKEVSGIGQSILDRNSGKLTL